MKKLKAALARARRRFQKEKGRRTARWTRVRDERRERAELREQRRVVRDERKKVRKRIERRKGEDPEVESDEAKLYELRVAYRDLGHEENRLSGEIDSSTERLRAKLIPYWRESARKARWWLQVRIPHIKRRIRAEEARLRAERISPTGSRLLEFDGKPCPEWLVYRLRVARAAGWKGRLNSGYRDPEYSEELCYRICGRPTCPGRCAGKSSNHTKKEYPDGAIDVSYPEDFEAIMRAKQNEIPGVLIYNALGQQDPWHQSRTGR